MNQAEQFEKDAKAVKQAFNLIQDYPQNTLAFLNELPDKQRFMACRLTEEYIRTIAYICREQENILQSLPKEDCRLVLHTLRTQPDSSLVNLPVELDAAYMKVRLATDKHLMDFLKQYNDILADANLDYKKTKPDAEKINDRAVNLAKLLNLIVNEDTNPDKQDKLPSYIKIPSAEILATLNMLDFIERHERITKYRSQLAALTSYTNVNSTLEGIQYFRETGKRLSDQLKIKEKMLLRQKKAALIRKKLAAELKVKKNKKRFSLKRTLNNIFQIRNVRSF